MIVRDCVNNLSVPLKEAIELQMFNNYSLKKISEICKINYETVKSRLKYARGKLKKCILREYRDLGLRLCKTKNYDR